MFFEDNLLDSSDSEQVPPPPARRAAGDEGVEATQSRGSSQAPISARGLSVGSVGSVSSAPGAAAAAPHTASEIQLLIEAAENERHCPDILPYPTTMVDGVMAHIKQRSTAIQALAQEERRSAASQTLSFLPFKPSDIMALELRRVQFFLCELLRCRLKKIEALCTTIFYEGQVEQQEREQQRGASPEADRPPLPPAETALRANLSANEKVVADELASAKQRAVMKAGLRAAPPALQYLTPHPPLAEGLGILPEPDLNTYVFGVALEDLGVVQAGEFAEQAISAGEIFLMPYRTFRPYVIGGRVRLL